MNNWWVCDMCYPTATEIGMIAPGFALTKIDREYHIIGGQGHKDDIIFTFPSKPYWDPLYYIDFLPDEEADKILESAEVLEDAWIEYVRHVTTTFKTFPHEGWYFTNSCIEIGFENDGDNLYCWLINKSAMLLEMFDNGFRSWVDDGNV